ncbi:MULTISPECIES: hypothetical protein [Bizionia]|uniref:Cyclase n=1 Tax=Bizionia algoritergicola TaxID=291187 RepID=A0A5D0QTL1_9FLAO|nr:MULTISPECIES: hypothetical protein [Bizionia]OBX21623.1 hypothetical protein BAA08_11955 [Bizionia sp. APA-3]TYB72051.1 hypothetical protein ES675_12865 [Bizionia algoritergicola]
MKTTIVTRHKVGSFDTWLKGHQDRLDIFKPAISGIKTFQDTDDPNSVAMTIEVTDMVKFQAILNDPATEVFKKKHTVIDPITVSIQVEH